MQTQTWLLLKDFPHRDMKGHSKSETVYLKSQKACMKFFLLIFPPIFKNLEEMQSMVWCKVYISKKKNTFVIAGLSQ